MLTLLLSSLLLGPSAPAGLDGGTAPAAGSGAAPASFWWGDYDGDGFPDAVVTQPGAPGRLLHNRGDGTFEDATERAGVPVLHGAHLALWSDYDGDGLIDLFLASYSDGSRLLRQTAPGSFEDATEVAGLDARLAPIEAEWTDVDSDRRADLRVSTAAADVLFHNVGRGQFQPVELDLPARVPLGLTPAASVDRARRPGGVDPTPPPGTGAPGAPGYAPICAFTIGDMANPGDCLSASSTPTLGMLYPLSTELYVDAGTGNVGMGTTTPGTRLDVLGGDIRTDSKLISTATSGPPLAVSSGQKVALLNADRLDGLDSAAFSQLGSSIEGSEITDGTVTASDLASGAVTSAKIAAGQIANSHVAAAAAIAGTKIAADFGAQAVKTSGQLVSTTTTQPPLAVSSAQKVPLLNADLLDGLDASVFSQLGNSIEGSEITNGTIGPADLANPLTASGVPAVVRAIATAAGGLALEGHSDASSGFGYGVQGSTDSTSGQGVFGWAKAASGPTYGVHGRSDSTAGVGVLGEGVPSSGSTKGVYGIVASPDGTGVVGENIAASGVAIGVLGKATAAAGTGVRGEAPNYGVHGIGTFGVRGDSSDVFGNGVFGMSTGIAGSGVAGLASADGASLDEPSAGVRGTGYTLGVYSAGVFGETYGSSGAAHGVYARNWSTTGSPKGVFAQTDAEAGDAVYGRASHLTGPAWGVRGETASPSGYGVYCGGDFAATGTKSFVQPHPADPSKELHFACLEGTESGTYFRGTARLVGGVAAIEVPEEFALATQPEGLTVVTTPVGAPASLWIEARGLDGIVVRGDADVEFDYVVNGVRRGFSDFAVVRENHSFVPAVRGVPFGTQYPEALRRILVESGVLNPDFTPNEETAGRLGWTLRDPVGALEEGGVPSGPAAKVSHEVFVGSK